MSDKAIFLCDANLTPIQCPNAWNPGQTDADGKPTPASMQPTDRPVYVQHGPWQSWMFANGFRPAFALYSLGRVGWWKDITLADYNAGKRGTFVAPDDPSVNPDATKAAVQACARLVKNPNLYGGSSVWDMPIWIDNEGKNIVASLWTDEATRQKALTNLITLLGWIRDVHNGRLWCYANQPPFSIDGPMNGPNRQIVQEWDDGKFDPVIEIVSDVCACFYNWNEPALDEELFYRDVDNVTERLNRRYAAVPKVAYLSPQFLINWGAKLTAAGKIVEPRLFEKQLQYVIAAGYREIYLWYNPLDPAMKFDLTNTPLLHCLQICKQYMFDPTPVPGASAADINVALGNS